VARGVRGEHRGESWREFRQNTSPVILVTANLETLCCASGQRLKTKVGGVKVKLVLPNVP
jgi:hypothetical protein